MADSAIERIDQAGHHVDHQSSRFSRLEFLANSDELAQISPFDEVHHQKMVLVLRNYLIDRHDVRVPQRGPHLSLAGEPLGFDLIVDETTTQHFDRADFAG